MRISDSDMKAALSSALKTIIPDSDHDAIAEQTVAYLLSGEYKNNEPSLLTINGKVLMYLISNPEASLQQCADSLGFTSATVASVMTRLVGVGWGVRTRSGRHNEYKFDPSRVLGHRDSIAFVRAVACLTLDQRAEGSDITPSGAV